MGVGGGLRRLNVLGLDLAWSDVDRGELREGYDVSISMSMSRSANLEKERGERGQSAGNKRLRAVRLRERAAARSLVLSGESLRVRRVSVPREAVVQYGLGLSMILDAPFRNRLAHAVFFILTFNNTVVKILHFIPRSWSSSTGITWRLIKAQASIL